MAAKARPRTPPTTLPAMTFVLFGAEGVADVLAVDAVEANVLAVDVVEADVGPDAVVEAAMLAGVEAKLETVTGV